MSERNMKKKGKREKRNRMSKVKQKENKTGHKVKKKINATWQSWEVEAYGKEGRERDILSY